MLKISQLREFLVYQEEEVQETSTIFSQLGDINGLKQIVTAVFKLIELDPNLSIFYKNKNTATLINKYTYFIANQIGATFDLLPPDIYKVHDDVGTPIFS